MENLGYNLLHWSSGEIPWKGQSLEEILQAKRTLLADLESMHGLLPYKHMGKHFKIMYTF